MVADRLSAVTLLLFLWLEPAHCLEQESVCDDALHQCGFASDPAGEEDLDDPLAEVVLLQMSLKLEQNVAKVPVALPPKSAILPGDMVNKQWLSLMDTLRSNVTICQHATPAEDRDLPMLKVLKSKEPPVDGVCYFNCSPTCVLAHQAKDYLVHPIAFGHFFASFRQIEYDFEHLHTAPGVAPLQAKMCLDMGWLDLPNRQELLDDFDLLDKKAEDSCESLRLAVPGYANITMSQYNADTALEGVWHPPGSLNRSHASKSELLWHQAAKCNMGHYALACDIADCLYHFCKLPGGLVGSGKQCRDDWMAKDITSKHLSPYYEFVPELPGLVASLSN